MVAEFAFPRSSAAIADSLKPAKTDPSRNVASSKPSKREQAVARLGASLDNSVLPNGSEQDLWAAFQGLIDSWDESDFATTTGETVAAVTAGEITSAKVLNFQKASTSDFLEESAELARPENQLSVGQDDRLVKKLLPFRLRAVESDFDPTPTWHEMLSTLGHEIQQVRQAQGLSLDQIRLRTQVPVYQLQALESGAVGQLPEEIFVRGFLKRICSQLGEEGQALLAQIPESRQEPPEILAQWQQPGVSSYAPQVVHLRSAHLYVGYATLLAGAAGGLAWSFQETAQVKDSPDWPQPTVQKAGAQAKLNSAQHSAQVAFGSDVAQPEQFAPELMP